MTMRARHGRTKVGFLLWATIALACGSGSSGGTPAKGRGSTACNQWQVAICAWASRCNSATAGECQEQANAISCISDQKATDCANAFNSASCGAPPAGCDIKDLPDPAPALAACQQFLDELCAAQIRCAPTTTAEQCHQVIDAQTDCSKMIGVKLSFEQCISEIRVLSCTATEAPASCKGALLSGG
jgi:hypothetical protein